MVDNFTNIKSVLNKYKISVDFQTDDRLLTNISDIDTLKRCAVEIVEKGFANKEKIFIAELPGSGLFAGYGLEINM